MKNIFKLIGSLALALAAAQPARADHYLKTGNNGISCNDYCAGAAWGTPGTCVGGYREDTGTPLDCSTAPGTGNTTCACNAAIFRPGNNGTTTCNDWCGRDFTHDLGDVNGARMQCVSSKRSDTSQPVDCNANPGFLSNGELDCYCRNIYDADTGSLCVKEDWDPAVCGLPTASDTRCATGVSAIHTTQKTCEPQACPPGVGGGCTGHLGSGEWYPISVNGQDLRCKCGCVAEETLFDTDRGQIAAGTFSSLPGVEVLSNDGFTGSAVNKYPVSDVISGPESTPVYTLTTKSGGSVTVTSAHPVVVVQDSAHPEQQTMTVPANLKVGQFLLTQDGRPDAITAIDQHAYSGRVVNFLVSSPSRLAYPNGFKMGDNAWQQYLARRDAHILTLGDIIQALKESN